MNDLDHILIQARNLGRKQGEITPSDAPIPGSHDLSDRLLAELESAYGAPLHGLALSEAESAYSEGVMDARCRRGISVRFFAAGTSQAVVLRGDKDALLAAAMTLATNPPVDSSAAAISAALTQPLHGPLCLLPLTGPPIPLGPQPSVP